MLWKWITRVRVVERISNCSSAKYFENHFKTKTKAITRPPERAATGKSTRVTTLLAFWKDAPSRTAVIAEVDINEAVKAKFAVDLELL